MCCYYFGFLDWWLVIWLSGRFVWVWDACVSGVLGLVPELVLGCICGFGFCVDGLGLWVCGACLIALVWFGFGTLVFWGCISRFGRLRFLVLFMGWCGFGGGIWFRGLPTWGGCVYMLPCWFVLGSFGDEVVVWCV